MIQESVQNIKTPWELIITIIVFMAVALVYLVKRSEKDSKYHRDRADRVDVEAKKDREKFNEVVIGFKDVTGKMADNMHNMGDKIDNKLDEVLREVRK